MGIARRCRKTNRHVSVPLGNIRKSLLRCFPTIEWADDSNFRRSPSPILTHPPALTPPQTHTQPHPPRNSSYSVVHSTVHLFDFATRSIHRFGAHRRVDHRRTASNWFNASIKLVMSTLERYLFNLYGSNGTVELLRALFVHLDLARPKKMENGNGY